MSKQTVRTVTLGFPVTFDGAEVSVLEMRRPKVKDMLDVPQELGEVEQDIQMYARLCGKNPELLHELDLFDLQKLQEAFQSFLSPKAAEKTGATQQSSSATEPAGATGK